MIVNELETIKYIDDIYLRLVYLIKITCLNQNNKELMREIYKGVNKITVKEDKITYLINCYLNNFGYDKVSVLRYIGIHIIMDINEIIDSLVSLKNKLTNKNHCDDLKSNIDYNLSHLKKQHLDKRKTLRKDLRKNKMQKIIRKKRKI